VCTTFQKQTWRSQHLYVSFDARSFQTNGGRCKKCLFGWPVKQIKFQDWPWLTRLKTFVFKFPVHRAVAFIISLENDALHEVANLVLFSLNSTALNQHIRIWWEFNYTNWTSDYNYPGLNFDHYFDIFVLRDFHIVVTRPDDGRILSLAPTPTCQMYTDETAKVWSW